MAYATYDELVTRLSEETLLYIADFDCDGVIDVAAVEAALEETCGEIAALVRCQYRDEDLPNPLPEAAASLLRSANISFAANLLMTGGTFLQTIRDDAERSKEWLQAICSGDSKLPIPVDPGSSRLDSQQTSAPRRFNYRTIGYLW